MARRTDNQTTVCGIRGGLAELAQNRYVQEYQKNTVGSASPLQLVIMLYDGALKHLTHGKAAMKAKDVNTQNLELQKAQRIVMELMSCLDMDQGGEIAKNLFGLYGFITNQLIEANVEDDSTKIDRCIQILTELRTSWVQIEDGLKKPKEEQQGDTNYAA